jgi:hypothetical protein
VSVRQQGCVPGKCPVTELREHAWSVDTYGLISEVRTHGGRHLLQDGLPNASARLIAPLYPLFVSVGVTDLTRGNAMRSL